MQRYYVHNPVGTVKITNTETFSLYDVDVSFFQKGYMDNPTKSDRIAELNPGETVEVPVYASFPIRCSPGKSLDCRFHKYSKRYPCTFNGDKGMSLSIDGTLWVPVEITLIGTDTFLNAWRTGIDEFSVLAQNPEKRNFIRTRDAQKVFSPAGLKETDPGLQ
ncbi:MAG: hypothetical protein DRP59_00740 [Spirochaetes bacterium]|nr:MAG: hypothetical protein DRP59_00740 [Spirochaetota bacterium]